MASSKSLGKLKAIPDGARLLWGAQIPGEQSPMPSTIALALCPLPTCSGGPQPCQPEPAAAALSSGSVSDSSIGATSARLCLASPCSLTSVGGPPSDVGRGGLMPRPRSVSKRLSDIVRRPAARAQVISPARMTRRDWPVRSRTLFAQSPSILMYTTSCSQEPSAIVSAASRGFATRMVVHRKSPSSARLERRRRAASATAREALVKDEHAKRSSAPTRPIRSQSASPRSSAASAFFKMVKRPLSGDKPINSGASSFSGGGAPSACGAPSNPAAAVTTAISSVDAAAVALVSSSVAAEVGGLLQATSPTAGGSPTVRVMSRC